MPKWRDVSVLLLVMVFVFQVFAFPISIHNPSTPGLTHPFRTGYSNNRGSGPTGSPSILSVPAHAAIWNKTFGGIGEDEGWSIIECTDGGFAILGTSDSFGVGDSDMWLIRTDALGTLLWEQRYGDYNDEEGNTVVECSDGGFALIGTTNNYTAHTSNILVLRTNSSGHMVWNRSYTDFKLSYGRSIVKCASEGFALIGDYQKYQYKPRNIWLIRVNDMGNHLWNATYNSTGYDYGFDLVECQNDGFALIGSATNLSDWNQDAWLIRTDATGIPLWNHTYGGPDDEQGRDVIECSTGGFAFIGWTESFGAGSQDAWLVRTNAGGDAVWDHTFGDTSYDIGSELIECSDEGFAFTGYTEVIDSAMWLVRTNAGGHQIWNHTYGLPEKTYGASLVGCGSGGYAMTGYFYNYGEPVGDTDVWVVRVPEDYPPMWVEGPTDQTLEFGTSFRYDLNATDSSGIHTWWINNTDNFAIDTNGIVTVTTSALNVEEYQLQVWVNDTYNNVLSGSFTVTVEGPPLGWIDPLLLVGSIGVVAVTVISVFFYYSRRKKL